MPGASFEAVTGRLGIGAIAVLGLFLLVDGLQIGVFEIIESNGGTISWGIVGAVPTIVVSYIVGVMCLGLAEALFANIRSMRSPPPSDIIAVSRTDSALLLQIYAEELRNRELLLGSTVAFLLLAVGAGFESSNIPTMPYVAVLAVLGALGLAVLSFLFSRRASRRAAAIAAAVR